MIAVLVAGCGSDHESANRGSASISVPEPTVEPTEPILTKTQFVFRANEVCREDRAEMLAEAADYRRNWRSDHGGAPPFVKEASDVLLTAIQFMYDHINFTGPPKGDETEAENILNTLQLTFVSAQELGVASPKQLSTTFNRYNELARNYGLDDCLITEAFLRG